MNQIQQVSRYITLSEEGLVPKLICPLDQGLLLANKDLYDKDYLYCLSCNYKRFVGTAFFAKIIKEIKRVDKNVSM